MKKTHMMPQPLSAENICIFMPSLSEIYPKIQLLKTTCAFKRKLIYTVRSYLVFRLLNNIF